MDPHQKALQKAAENDEEMLDLLDETGKVVGVIQRSQVHGNPALRHRAVHIFVVNASDEYFLQKRSPYKKVQPDKWDTSVGGHIPAGEDYEQGALRELREELGVELRDASSLRFHHDYVWSNYFETEHIRTYLLTYDGPFHLNEAEVSDGRFWSAEELRASYGKGVFTPNLEMELMMLGVFKG
jgi:isopentenyldiphosphate isomerase